MKRSRIALMVILAVAVAVGVLRVHFYRKNRAVPAEPLVLSSGWQLQDVAKVPQPGTALSRPGFRPGGWYAATVPGTVLTTLVDRGVYPEPLYGENNRPDKIPESLCRTSYWYRTVCQIPTDFQQKPLAYCTGWTV